MRSVRSLSVVAALLLVAAACTSAKPGWTYAPAPSATPLPSVSASGSAGGERLSLCVGVDRAVRVGVGLGVRFGVRRWRWRGAQDRGPEHRLRHHPGSRPGEHPVPDPLHQQRPRDPAQRRDPRSVATRRSSRARSSRASAETTYDVPALPAGRVHVRLRRPPEHDRDPHRRVTPPASRSPIADAYATIGRGHASATSRPATSTLVVLDRTVFYPGGGGQPSDRGLILRTADGRGWSVRGARKAERRDRPRARTGRGDPPAVGDTSQVDLDWARRYALMRTHTALHALCGVVWRDHGAQVTGGNMEPGVGADGFRVRVDVG